MLIFSGSWPSTDLAVGIEGTIVPGSDFASDFAGAVGASGAKLVGFSIGLVSEVSDAFTGFGCATGAFGLTPGVGGVTTGLTCGSGMLDWTSGVIGVGVA